MKVIGVNFFLKHSVVVAAAAAMAAIVVIVHFNVMVELIIVTKITVEMKTE